ncbi:MAG: YcjF family protein [Desulfuromonadaceae bacterium]
MSDSTEKVNAIPTRKRLLFETHQKNTAKSEEQQLSDAVMGETVTEAAIETVVTDTVSANTSMELAELKFAEDKAASRTAAATASLESSGEESKKNITDEPFQKAMATLHTYSAMSAATGLIPLPLVDIAGLMTIQLLMLKKLSKHYNIPFDSQRSKSAIAILVSGVNSGYIAASSSKWIPFIGGFSMAAMPVVNGALSYAVGRVFIKHFASGGTFRDFDPVKARDYFEVQYRK